ncbi:MAG: hypothetical protein KAU07_03310 [Candidatus Andersenbacteria bacterium]|nr:hypothetical protein [Candidatus Andersenbacteria bacterium]
MAGYTISPELQELLKDYDTDIRGMIYSMSNNLNEQSTREELLFLLNLIAKEITKSNERIKILEKEIESFKGSIAYKIYMKIKMLFKRD